MPRTGEGDLFGRGIDALNLGRLTAIDQEFGECTVAAADINASQVRRQREPVEKLIADETAPDAHHVLVGVPVGEMLL
jgi:hypothetical protein